VVPADGRAFKGVRFDFRGKGEYSIGVMAPSGLWTRTFSSQGDWSSQQVPFELLARPADDAVWTPDSLLAVHFLIERGAGETAWMKIDNVSFY
jgi:hypothetical protein